MKKLTIILTAASERAKAIKGTTPPSRPMAILTNQHKVNNVNKRNSDTLSLSVQWLVL